MPRARRSSLLALLLLLAAQGAPPRGAPLGGAPSGREEAARRQVEESERVLSAQVDAEKAAAERAAGALSEEKRLGSAQAVALERLKRAETAVRDMTRHLAELRMESRWGGSTGEKITVMVPEPVSEEEDAQAVTPSGARKARPKRHRRVQ